MIECIKKAEAEFYRLKKELGIKKDIENWGNMNISVRKHRNKYVISLNYARYKQSSITYFVDNFPLTTPKEEILNTNTYQKAQRLVEVFQVLKRYRELIEACRKAYGE